jgi:hypothetical protein
MARPGTKRPMGDKVKSVLHAITPPIIVDTIKKVRS